MEEIKKSETEKIEFSIPMIGLVRGIWIMVISAFAFIGISFVFTYALFDPSFDIVTKSLLGSLLAASAFGAVFGISRYLAEEQIKYIVVNMKLNTK
jgi:Kef-type K+ transport system membrane component KefB